MDDEMVVPALKKIILADDKLDFIDSMGLLLQFKGFDVILAQSAFDALSKIKNDCEIEYLLADVLMSPDDGIVLARQAKDLVPDLRVGLMSIVPADELMLMGYNIDGLKFTDKVVRAKDLLEFIGEL